MDKRMKEDYRYFGGMSVLYGCIFACCLYRSMSGITFPVCVAATLLFSGRYLARIGLKPGREAYLYGAGILLLGISTAYTSSWFFHMCNLAGILLLFVVMMLRQFYREEDWGFAGWTAGILRITGTTVLCIPDFYIGGADCATKAGGRGRSLAMGIGIGSLASAGLLCVILPLLVKSDLIFRMVFGNVAGRIHIGTTLGWALTALAGATLSYAFFQALCRRQLPEKAAGKPAELNPVIGITFSGILGGVYAVYCAIQLAYLFPGSGRGLPGGISYAAYARSGFWELLAVSLINFALVLTCMRLFRESRALSGILTGICGCTFIMIGSAVYRMALYVGAYHLTFLRVLALWFLAVLALIMAGVTVSIYRKSFPLFRYLVLVVGACWILFAFSRPDARIVQYNLAHSREVAYEDFYYYLHELSLDAASAVAQIDPEKVAAGEGGPDPEQLRMELDGYFSEILSGQSRNGWRQWNYSEWQAKRAAACYFR